MVLLMRESSGASGIGSTISAMPTFKVMCLTGASRWSSRKSWTPVHLIGYKLILSRVAEEFGGARTAYYYDLLLRQKLAKELGNGAASVHGFLMHFDRDVLGHAKAKVESIAKSGLAVIWRRWLWFAIWSTSSEEWQGSTKACCWKVLGQCVVIKSVEQAWCQVTLAATVRQRRQTEER